LAAYLEELLRHNREHQPTEVGRGGALDSIKDVGFEPAESPGEQERPYAEGDGDGGAQASPALQDEVVAPEARANVAGRPPCKAWEEPKGHGTDDESGRQDIAGDGSSPDDSEIGHSHASGPGLTPAVPLLYADSTGRIAIAGRRVKE
jgi:hypothetical protein